MAFTETPYQACGDGEDDDEGKEEEEEGERFYYESDDRDGVKKIIGETQIITYFGGDRGGNYQECDRVCFDNKRVYRYLYEGLDGSGRWDSPFYTVIGEVIDGEPVFMCMGYEDDGTTDCTTLVTKDTIDSEDTIYEPYCPSCAKKNKVINELDNVVQFTPRVLKMRVRMMKKVRRMMKMMRRMKRMMKR